MSVVRPSPTLRLVSDEEADRLRQQIEERSQRRREHEFWQRFNDSRQPTLIEDQPETLPPFLRAKVDDDFFGPIG
jgi:hypothetical protein